jgi:ABC-2 type transport system permease protein
MTISNPTISNRSQEAAEQPSALAEISQETLALTRRLFLQLQRRPSTLVAGVLQPLIWLVLFGALFAKAPAGLLPGGISYGRFLGAGVIVFTAFSAALNAGLPVMFDREFGFLNRLLVAPLRSRSSIVLASVLYITSLSLVQSLAIMATAALLGYGWPGGGGLAVGAHHPFAVGVCGHGLEPGLGLCPAGSH